jgi:membrane fusion protein, multidrug efflux system
MSTSRRPLDPMRLGGILPAVLITVALLSCGDPQRGRTDAAADSSARKRGAVTVTTISPSTFSETLQLTGYIKATEDVTVSTEESGVLKQWLVERGRRVRKGEVIALLNDDVLRPQYEAAKAQYQIAQLNFEKQQKVFEDQGISEIQAKTSEYTRDAARAQANLMQARLERMRIKSPVDGTLDDRLVDEGELAPPGIPVARIVNLDRMKLLINAPEQYAGTLAPGAAVKVSVAAYPAETFTGRISFVGAAVIPDNRTVPIEVTLKNAGRRLKPDMIARAVVTQTVPRKAILVDEGVVQMVDPKTYIVYVAEQGTARRRTVSIGARNNGRVEILSGLREGDHLIISGYQNVFDGQKVDITLNSGSQPEAHP